MTAYRREASLQYIGSALVSLTSRTTFCQTILSYKSSWSAFIIEIDIKPNLLTLSAVFSSEASREILKHDLALTEGAIQKSNLSHLLSCNYEGAQSLQRIDSSPALFVFTNSYHFSKFSFNCQ